MRGKCEQANPDCKYYPNCYTDTHHRYFPKKLYKTKLERAFRKATTVELCRRVHDEVHARWCGRNQNHPIKPTAAEMRQMIEEVKNEHTLRPNES